MKTADIDGLLRRAWGAFARARVSIEVRVAEGWINYPNDQPYTDGMIVDAHLCPVWTPEPNFTRFRVNTTASGSRLELRIRNGGQWWWHLPPDEPVTSRMVGAGLDEGFVVRALLFNYLVDSDSSIEDDCIIVDRPTTRRSTRPSGDASTLPLLLQRRPSSDVPPISLGLSQGSWWCEYFKLEIDSEVGILRRITAKSADMATLIDVHITDLELDAEISDELFEMPQRRG